MKNYSYFTPSDFKDTFQRIRENTLIFDDLRDQITCIRYGLLDCLKHDDIVVSETAYHTAKLINLLKYWEIYKGEKFTDEKIS